MRHRWSITAAAALLLTLTACGGELDGTDPPPPATEPPEATFVGSVDDADALIALIVANDAVTVYVCGRDDTWESLTAWFEGAVTDGQITSLNGGWDLELDGRFDGSAWSGSLVASGRTYGWSAQRANEDSAAGLYVLDTDSREAGLIVTNALETAGVYYGKTSTQTAPVRVVSDLTVATRPSSVEVFSSVYGGRTFTLRPVTRAIATPRITPERQLRQALTRALPGLRSFQLASFDDASVVRQLRTLAEASPDEPQYVSLPVVDDRGALRTDVSWTVYHHDVRDPRAQSCFLDPREGPRCEPIAGPSLTFQGMPDLPFRDFRELHRRAQAEPEAVARELSDERVYQLSTLGIVGNELVGSYAGQATVSPSVIQGLTSIFEVAYGPERTAALLDLTAHNYLVYNRRFYDEPLEMPAPPLGPAGPTSTHHHAHGHHGPEDSAHPRATERIVTPQRHLDEFDDFPILRPMMVADATIWDAEAQAWLVDTFFERADYVANVQANAFNWLQLFPDAPAGSSTLDEFSNALAVRTQIGGYWRLTPFGQELLQYPDASCGGAGSFIDEIRKLSPDSKTLDNEYWAWWTNHQPYGLGCAYVGTFGNTGRNAAVSWQHISAQTLDATASTFMHETGHLMDGMHGGPTHPWATDSQRCRLLGILEVGPTGPSLMRPRIAGTTRTNCFAPTLAGDTTTKNMTRVAEHMHVNLE